MVCNGAPCNIRNLVFAVRASSLTRPVLGPLTRALSVEQGNARTEGPHSGAKTKFRSWRKLDLGFVARCHPFGV